MHKVTSINKDTNLVEAERVVHVSNIDEDKWLLDSARSFIWTAARGQMPTNWKWFRQGKQKQNVRGFLLCGKRLHTHTHTKVWSIVI